MRADRLTLVAFAAAVVFGGVNAVAVRFSNAELAPFWGAALRFAVAALAFWAILAARRLPLPRGRALTGALVYGAISFGASYGFIYIAMQDAPAGVAMVVLALVPLMTLLLAVAHGLEPFRWRGVAGGLLAVAGIAVVFGDQVSAAVPPLSLLLLVAGAVCIAESGIVVKWFPRSHPVVSNAVGMLTGTAILFGLSIAASEPRALPALPATWAALAYLVTIGSIGIFTLFLFILARWTASATSYQFLLMPLVTVVVAAVLAREPVSPIFLLGGTLVLAGVYVGAFAPAPPARVPAEAAVCAPAEAEA
ncbi:MAG: hypothetical protein A2X23_00190 [Chloroflexi bacterium GWC2_73_18]|nr:MAG: hypothetical protein A2X23_00190 [Chloroflexi bacterium GWC2_73_18]